MWRALFVVAWLGCRSTPAPVGYDGPWPLDAPTTPGAGPGGGTVPGLTFAVVGDTRPANIDDTLNYPTAIAQAVWTAMAADAAKPMFAVTTGDYMFASTNGTEVDPQLDLYLGARSVFPNIVYPALGNHECASSTDSNCGPSGTDGEPPNYTRFVSRLLGPIGELRPYYVERFAAADGTWTAKFVFIAANAWSSDQQKWLDRALAEPTTYTFAVRHEPPESTTAPGVTPSTTLLATYPLTMLITGHTHTYRHVPAYREIIVGNGGAPLSAGPNYGYVTVVLRPDGLLDVNSYDYMTHAAIDSFTIDATGVIH